MKNVKSDPVKTMLTISMGFVVIFLVTKIKWILLIALGIGLIGMFSTYLSKKIDFLWMKLAWVLSLIVPNILLSAIFYGFLFPISLLSKLFGAKDPLQLKKPTESAFRTTNKTFDKASLEKPW